LCALGERCSHPPHNTVSLRIRWQIEQQSGAFPLRNRPLHLLWAEDALDILNDPPTAEQDGLSVSPPDAEGKLELKASGAFRFMTGDKSFRTVRLPIGGKVAMACGELRGRIHADGEPVVADPMIGKVLGGHKLLARLGAGAVGVVYRALQVDLDREVALKLLNSEATKMPLAVASFRREAQAAGRLSHPNLVQVYNVGKDDGFHYYTMELVPGGDFEGRLKEGPMPWKEAVGATRDCAAALAYADEHGLVHRDVKPENLMIGSGGLRKLADLGLAATRGMLDKEAAGGTPHFMAPEAVGKGQARHQSDLYSLGCTLYRLLTGGTVFEGSSVKEILLAHRDEEPPTLKQAGVEAPRELEDLLASLLAKDPEDRPEHASEVVEDLEALLSHQGGSRKVLLLAIPILAFGAWGAFQAFGPGANGNGEPEKVVEYVNVGADEGTQAALLAEKEKSSFFQAMAAPEGPARTESLQAFLTEYPEGDHAEQANAEIARLEELAAAEAVANTPSPEEQARLAALEIASAQVRKALDDQLFASARQLVRSGELAAETEMLTLAAVVDQRTTEQFSDWEGQHQAALDALNWDQASTLRGSFAASLVGDAPEEWNNRLAQLETRATAARNTANASAFTDLRVAFQAQAGQPVRDAVGQLEIQKAGEYWNTAAQNCGHGELQQLAQQQAPLFEAGARARGLLQKSVGTGLTLVEAEAGRKAKLLDMTAEGLKIEVQVSGNREQRVQPWSMYQQPKQWQPLMTTLLPEQAAGSSDLHALFLLVLWNDVANGFEELGQNFNSAQAGRLMARLKLWREHAPATLEDDAASLLMLQTGMDLCQAVLHDDHYLAFNRLQSLQNQFSLLSVWSGSGLSTWGLKP
jgi:hypothetical protein